MVLLIRSSSKIPYDATSYNIALTKRITTLAARRISKHYVRNTLMGKVSIANCIKKNFSQ